MYRQDPELRSEEEEINLTYGQIQEYIKCKNDITYFAKYFYITSADGFKPIELRKYQKKVLADITDPLNKNNIIIMHRQSGKTVLNALYALHYAIFNQDKNIMVTANKCQMSYDLLRIIKEAYHKLPLWMQPGLKDEAGSWKKDSIKLANGCTIIAGATSVNLMRGRTIDLLICDEFAFLPNDFQEEFLACVIPTQSERPNAKIIISSSPNGYNCFRKIWTLSGKGKFAFKQTFVNVFDDERFTPEDIEQLKVKYGIQFVNREYESLFMPGTPTMPTTPNERKRKIIVQINQLLCELIEIDE